MGKINPKYQRIHVWSEESDSFDGNALKPVWHVAIEEFRSYISGNKWEPVAMVVTHAKSKQEAANDAAMVLREWADIVDESAD